MMTILAEVLISGEWLTGIVVAIITAFGGIYLKARKDGENSREVTVKKPVPTIQVREEQRFVGRDEFLELTHRMTTEHTKLWGQFSEERKIWNHEIESIQKRQDSQSTAIASLQGTVDEVNKTVGQLLAIALNARKPGTRP